MSRQKRRIYEFDNFRLDVGERQLLRDGKPVVLSAKAFDLLLVLVEHNGHLIGKDELYNRVWRDQTVEESNLTVQMSAIRKALGDRGGKRQYIGTVIGSGYRFTADVREVDSLSDEELIIESEMVERVIIEKEEEIARVAENNGAKYIETNKTSSADAPLTESRNRKPVLLITILVVLLLAAVFGGYWLYRERSKASVSPMPTSRGQMTITRVTDGRLLGASAISPDGKFVAYIENSVAGAGTLFVQQIDTNTALELLERDSRTFGCVNFSPDSSLVYYVAFDKRDPYGALYSVPVLGGMPKRITDNLGSCFAVSPDGKRAAFYRNDSENNQINLMIAALDGSSEQTQFHYAVNQWSFGLGLAWSPDGSLIAISADTEPNDLVGDIKIFGVDVTSGAIKPLTGEQFSSVGKISWTSDGRNLVFVARRPRGENELFMIDYPSGEARQITNDLESYGNYGLGVTADSDMLVADVWERKSEIWRVDANGDASKTVRVKRGTTDGRLGITALPDNRIAYVARTSTSLEIWTAQEDGTQAQALTTDEFTQRDIAASPDGRYLVYASDQAGDIHIFRMNADDGSEVKQLTFGANLDSQPKVSPDGNWVIYTSYIGKRHTVWKVPIQGGASVQLTDYESGSPVFAPDGKTIACVLPQRQPRQTRKHRHCSSRRRTAAQNFSSYAV